MPPIMIIRHAEKPLPGAAPRGVDADGMPDPESLTPRGWQRAGALVGLFAGPRPAAVPVDLPTPTHLFASQVGPRSSSRRPHQTLEPLSARLGVGIDDRFLKEEIDRLCQAIRAIDGAVLVCWEHHLIPSIATLLTGTTTGVPQIWPDDRFDVVWVIERGGDGTPTGLRQVPELLLAGDAPSTIGDAPPVG